MADSNEPRYERTRSPDGPGDQLPAVAEPKTRNLIERTIAVSDIPDGETAVRGPDRLGPRGLAGDGRPQRLGIDPTVEPRSVKGDGVLDSETGVAGALMRAIRAFTVDAPNDQPNGPAERALVRLGDALDAADWPGSREARVAYSELCERSADDIRDLRIAAETYFGGDFRADPVGKKPYSKPVLQELAAGSLLSWPTLVQDEPDGGRPPPEALANDWIATYGWPSRDRAVDYLSKLVRYSSEKTTSASASVRVKCSPRGWPFAPTTADVVVSVVSADSTETPIHCTGVRFEASADDNTVKLVLDTDDFELDVAAMAEIQKDSAR
jgi:hypothetical protein